MLTEQDIAEAKRALKELADEAQGNGNSEGWIAAQERPILAVIAAHEAKAAPAEPFGYFRAEPLGWTDCAADDEGAIALYERPAAGAVPQGAIYEMADALYKRGYTDLQSGKDYDPRGCDEWQEVVDWLTPAAPSQPAVPQGWVNALDRVPLESDGEVFIRFTDGSIGTGWATYWHGASNGFAQWTFPDPDEYRAVLEWAKNPTAPSQEPAVPQELCPTCGEDRPFSGTCGTSDSDTRALCKRKCAPSQKPVTLTELLRQGFAVLMAKAYSEEWFDDLGSIDGLYEFLVAEGERIPGDTTIGGTIEAIIAALREKDGK